MQVDSHTFPARDGDVFLLCSDGLTDMVGEAVVAEVLAADGTLQAAARGLIERANDAGGRDNITVDPVPPGGGSAPGPGGRHRRRGHARRRRRAARRGRAPRARGAGTAPSPRPSAPRAEPGRRRTPVGARARPAPPRRAAPSPPARHGLDRRRLLPRGARRSAAYLASQTVYFVGSDADGFVSIYRGVPYELPAGLSLYHRDYVSGVSAAQLTAAAAQDRSSSTGCARGATPTSSCASSSSER